VLIARHENEIGGTTDVAEHPQFAGRRRSQVIDGETMTGWFTEDFTLAEIKTLRARERCLRCGRRILRFDGRFLVPTFDEIMELATTANRARAGLAPIGVYPETKHPAHFAKIGLAQELPVVDTLERHGYGKPGSPVFIQSFDPNNLRFLRELTRCLSCSCSSTRSEIWRKSRPMRMRSASTSRSRPKRACTRRTR
jgi:glycerophosphoryl diester phosphodiesterase